MYGLRTPVVERRGALAQFVLQRLGRYDEAEREMEAARWRQT
jgi:hypothetical protein